jgi:SAM-dependent methyltransferase
MDLAAHHLSVMVIILTMQSKELDPRLAGYLTTNRDFLAPAVAQAVASLKIPDGARVLDMGTGAGGAIPPLAQAAGPTGTVLAIDLNPAVIALARRHAAQAEAAATATVQTRDATDVLADTAATPDTAFDAIWTGDVVWPGNFDDPGQVVRLMAQALKPGGVVALFYSNYYQSSFLPGRSRLERTLRTASELRWGLPADGPRHYERHLAWLLDAGLEEVRLQVFPLVGFPADEDPRVRAYLESAVWPELLESAAAYGAAAGLSPAELEEVRALLTPGSPRYIMGEPGFFIVHPTIMATGRRPWT